MIAFQFKLRILLWLSLIVPTSVTADSIIDLELKNDDKIGLEEVAVRIGKKTTDFGTLSAGSIAGYGDFRVPSGVTSLGVIWTDSTAHIRHETMLPVQDLTKSEARAGGPSLRLVYFAGAWRITNSSPTGGNRDEGTAPSFGLQSPSSDPIGKQFLRFAFGDGEFDTNKISGSASDLWIIQSPKNNELLNELREMPASAFRGGIVSGILGQTLYCFEIKQDKIDPTFYIESVYANHRQIVLRFLAAAITRNRRILEELSTDASGLQFTGEAIDPSDPGILKGILPLFPVIRVSNPVDDATTHTVSYRVPLGSGGLTFKMVRANGSWKIDTSRGLSVSSDLFSNTGRRRSTDYKP